MALRIRRNRAGSSKPPEVDEGRMTLAEHLTELRSRVIKAVAAIFVGGIVGFAIYNLLLDEVLLPPYCQVLPSDRDCTLVVIDPLEGFSVRMKVSAYVGLLIASPVVMWQLWRFITPGLYDREKRYAVPFVAASVILFLTGSGLALATFPQALDFLVNIGGENLETFYTPTKYLSLITFMMLAFGVGFLFPVLLAFLQLAGLLHWRTLGRWRRYAIVAIFAVTAVITPSGDPFTLMALGVPLCLFYEASILFGRFILKRR